MNSTTFLTATQTVVNTVHTLYSHRLTQTGAVQHVPQQTHTQHNTTPPPHTHLTFLAPEAQWILSHRVPVVCAVQETMLKATQLGLSLPARSGGDDTNERDVFDRLFEAAPEKLGAVKTVNSTRAQHVVACTIVHPIQIHHSHVYIQ